KYAIFNNGYNLTTGRQTVSQIFNEEHRDEIVKLIETTALSFSKIGEMTGYSIYTVSDINRGYLCPKDGLDYPIRKNRATQLYLQDDVEVVTVLLKESDFSFAKIAEITQTDFSFVYDVNRGKRMPSNIEKYPIRPSKQRPIVSIELARSVVNALKENVMSAEEIGELFGLPTYTVGQINRGKLAICKQLDESFPIQKKPHRSRTNYSARKIDNNQLKEVVDMLLNTSVSTEEIARKFNVNKTSIDRINRGAVFKEELKQYKFPLRQNKDYNLMPVA
ncbi:MAG: hypothetical protein LUB59_05500, partial [Candidatus Gastranaerophilales bacterium]|nr:hypothetical protein [Candidatus Gastranaerophilales bacterium]